jgi:hypothetical protein
MTVRIVSCLRAKQVLWFMLCSPVWFWYSYALSNTVMEPDPKVSYARATHVVVARIVREHAVMSSNQACGSTYEAIVLSSAKGSIPKGTLTSFGFLSGLEQGVTYRLYLLSDAPRSAWADILASRIPASKNSDAWLEQCVPLHPTKTIVFRSNRQKDEK